MTIYAETVFIGNFLTDSFIFAITLTILKSKIRPARFFFAGISGGILAAVYPLTGAYGVLLRIASVFFLPAVLRKNAVIREYLLTLGVMLSVTISLGGCAFALISSGIPAFGYKNLTYGTFPILMSAAGLSLVFLLRYLHEQLYKTAARNGNIYPVRLFKGDYVVKCDAYYDSGNMVYNESGDMVIIVDEDIYGHLAAGDEERVEVFTFDSGHSIYVTDVYLEIFFTEESRLYRVKAGKGAVPPGSRAILHSDLIRS